jgi:hypothetical protein
MIIF